MLQLQCPHCSMTIAGEPGMLARCPTCGYEAQVPGARAPVQNRTFAAPPGQPAPWQPAPVQVQPTTTNGLATASLILGILGFFLYGIPSIVGLILGLVALKQIKDHGQAGRGLAITGIVLGAIMLALGLMILIFFSFLFGL